MSNQFEIRRLKAALRKIEEAHKLIHKSTMDKKQYVFLSERLIDIKMKLKDKIEHGI